MGRLRSYHHNVNNVFVFTEPAVKEKSKTAAAAKKGKLSWKLYEKYHKFTKKTKVSGH